YNDIAIDSNDKVHIVFYRYDNENIYHSTNATASGNWETNDIDTNGDVGEYCSIAIDSNDGLHVSYFKSTTSGSLKYAYKASGSNWGSSWSTTTVDNAGGKYTSIAIDSNDKPHIVYRDGGSSNGGDLAYAEKTSGSWSVDSPLLAAGDVALTSIAIDSDDHIHIAYYDSNNNDMDYYTNTSGSWANTFLENIGASTGGMDLDIAIDPTTDQPGISYFDKIATALKYTYYTGSSWSSATVENSADYGRFNSIAYDSLGNVHISHERNVDDDLYYTSDKTGSWVSTAVDTNAAGVYTAIAVDSNDDAHIAYRYNTNTGKRLYVATVQGHNAGSVTRTNVTGATCSISPSLPSGLTLNQGTCTISGTPTVAGSNTTYNLTATASTGISKTGEFNLWVVTAPNSLAYSPENMTLTKGVAMSTNTPSVGGGAVTSWEITPAVPSGLSFSSSTGAISGTPSVLQTTAVTYTVWANNSAGSTSASVNITINDVAVSSITYTPENQILTLYHTMVTTTPSTTGGTATSWAIHPTLPTGLSFNTATGAVSGTPETLQTTKVTYTVWANNSGGSISDQI
ncbi:MAG TPA: Ig domain-containing protein, partial [Candidatus Thalassarchaeaceae archaeon]|nr:Ig domain-containing protein [Candidatus Thalassarchaeaceae archaeon]